MRSALWPASAADAAALLSATPAAAAAAAADFRPGTPICLQEPRTAPSQITQPSSQTSDNSNLLRSNSNSPAPAVAYTRSPGRNRSVSPSMRRSSSGGDNASSAAAGTRVTSPAQQQHVRNSLETASSVASRLAMLSLTGAARPVMASPGQIQGQGAVNAAAAAASADGLLLKAPGLRFPEVSIVFAAVEGAAQLSGHPALAR
jgi:hypothetical protein